MKHHIHSSIVIAADCGTVWQTLTNFQAYPSWNSFIKKIEGNIAVGHRFYVEIDTMKFKPVTQVFTPNQEFTWLGRLFIPGIFDGKHSFVLEDNGNGTTTLIHKESFSGILVGLMKKKLDNDILPKFNHMNRLLKAQIELRN